jgi:DNA modification methylase
MLLNDDQIFHVHHGDCIPHLHEMLEASVDFSVYSPPFPSVYSYTSEACDLGNTEDLKHEIKLHFGFFFRGVRRVMKPGRVMLVHCQQIVRMKRAGGEGIYDFRGLLIRLAQRCGFVYDYDWLIRKNPQSQAIRTKSRALQFAGLEKDRAQSRGAMGDYLIKFLTPGENAVPIASEGQVSRNDWIDWAEPSWEDIRETDTLNTEAARGESDTRHICALQLSLIDRAVRLYSNPGEIVASPFAGIGSELYTAIKLGRRAYGCELKDEYHAECLRNLERAAREYGGGGKSAQLSIFDAVPAGEGEAAA